MNFENRHERLNEYFNQKTLDNRISTKLKVRRLYTRIFSILHPDELRRENKDKTITITIIII